MYGYIFTFPKKQHKIPTTKKSPCKIEQKLLLPNISLCYSFHLICGKVVAAFQNNLRGGVFAVLPRAQDSLQHPYSEMQSEGTKNGDSEWRVKRGWRDSFLATRWAPAIYKWSYNPYKYGYNPSYPFLRPVIGVITRGPPCIQFIAPQHLWVQKTWMAMAIFGDPEGDGVFFRIGIPWGFITH